MAATIVDLRNDVFEYLSGQSFSIACTWHNGNVFFPQTEKVRDPQAYVYPMGKTPEVDTRDEYRWTYRIGVTVRDYLQEGSTPEIDDLILLTEEIANSLLAASLDDLPLWEMDDESETVAFDVTEIETGHQFQSSIQVTYLHMQGV